MKELEENINSLTSNYKVKGNLTNVQAWEQVRHRVTTGAKPTKSFRIGWPYWVSAAAAVFVGALLLLSRPDKTAVISDQHVTTVAQTEQITMPDSSTIFLQPNSTVNWEYNNKQRSVELKGEAFFNIEKGGEFLVKFSGGEVHVLGTSFNVVAYDSNLVRVECSEGLVKVNMGEQSFLLNKGQGIKLFNGNISGPFDVQIESIEQQTEGVYVWNKIALEELFALIGQRFNYTITIDDPIKTRHFSGVVELNDIIESLEIITMAMNINYTIDDTNRSIFINAN